MNNTVVISDQTDGDVELVRSQTGNDITDFRKCVTLNT